MLQTIINAFKVKEIRRKVYMMLLLLLVFRIGCFIPVPGIDSTAFKEIVSAGGNDFLTLMSSITGGALAQGTLFSLGIGPYINASIIMQLLSVGIPSLERLSKQGEEGRKKISQYTRYLTILLAIIQSVGIIINFARSSGALDEGVLQVVHGRTWLIAVFMTVVYTAGALIVMWIGERSIDDYLRRYHRNGWRNAVYQSKRSEQGYRSNLGYYCVYYRMCGYLLCNHLRRPF